MKTRMTVAAVSLCVLLATTPAAASANSGPVYWENTPSFSVMPLKNCPVTVEREDLSFDFSGNREGHYSPMAEVTAVYRMKNPTGKAIGVQTAFPLIASLPDISPTEDERQGVPVIGDTLSISVDGKAVPFETFPGVGMPEAGVSRNYYTENGGLVKTSLPGFDAVLKSVNAGNGRRKIVTGSGQRYGVTAEQGGGVQVRTSGKSTYLLSHGFSGMSSDGSSVTLSANDLKKGESVSFLALGGEAAVTAISSDGKPDPAGKLEIRKTNCTIDAYVQEMLRESRVCRADKSENLFSHLMPRVEDSMESFFADGNHAYGDSNLYDFLQQQRLIVLCFETQFPAGGERTVTVKYAMSGSMDSVKTQKPVYSYAYLLNPAKGWAGFRDLNIRIVPPKEAPNLVAGSLSFKKSPGGAYTASLPSLPQNDLTFSLCESQRIEPKQTGLSGSTLFLLGAAALAVIVAVCLTVRYLRKRKRKREQG